MHKFQKTKLECYGGGSSSLKLCFWTAELEREEVQITVSYQPVLQVPRQEQHRSEQQSFFQIQSELKLKRKKKMNLLKVIPELKLSEKSKPSESDLDSAVPSVWTCIQLIQKRKGMFNTLHTFRRFQSIQKRRLTAEKYCKKQISADLKSKTEISERGFQTKGKWSFPKNSMWGKDENSILYIFSGSNWAFWLTAYIDMDSNGAIEFIMTYCTTPAFSNIPSCPEGWDIYSICN